MRFTRCYKEIPLTGDTIIDTGNVSATVNEALARNEPDDVIFDMLKADQQDWDRQNPACMKYSYFIDDHRACDKEFIFNPPFDGVECYGESNPDAASYFWDVYPLHLALQKGRSAEVISSILSKFEEAVYKENRVWERSGFYWLPLHYAASYGAPPEIVKELLLKFPQALDVGDQHSKEQERTPRDLARRAGPELSPESLSMLMKPTSYWEAKQAEGNIGITTVPTMVAPGDVLESPMPAAREGQMTGNTSGLATFSMLAIAVLAAAGAFLFWKFTTSAVKKNTAWSAINIQELPALTKDCAIQGNSV